MSALPQNSLAGAREFYRERLAMAFRYSRQFSQPLGSVAEDVAGTPEFVRLLQECPFGSFECARRIGEMAVVYLDRVPGAGINAPESSSGSPDTPPPARPAAWWRDLLNYERAGFLQAATTAESPPANRPRRGISAVCMNFSWAAPEMIERIQAGQAIAEDLRRPSTLLFARTQDGRVYVVEVGPAIEKVFRATNGLRTMEGIAAAAGIACEQTTEILRNLAGIGAVVLAKSPEEMLRMIEEREQRRE